MAHYLRVSGFYSAGWYAADRPRNLGIVMGHYEHPRLVATAQIFSGTETPSAFQPRDIERSGWSVFVEPRQGPNGWAALVRLDGFDPDEALDDNAHMRVIAGAAYGFTWNRARLGLVATNEQVHYDAPTRLTENRLLLQTHVEF